MSAKHTPTKPKLIQIIHIGKSKLGLDEETYRHMLKELTGKDSSKQMTKPELLKVLDELRNKGFVATKPKRAGKLKQADDSQSKMIRGLWLELHELGAVNNPSEAALAKYIERQTKVSALQFLSTQKASKVIEGLKKWRSRAQKQPSE